VRPRRKQHSAAAPPRTPDFIRRKFKPGRARRPTQGPGSPLHRITASVAPKGATPSGRSKCNAGSFFFARPATERSFPVGFGSPWHEPKEVQAHRAAVRTGQFGAPGSDPAEAGGRQGQAGQEAQERASGRGVQEAWLGSLFISYFGYMNISIVSNISSSSSRIYEHLKL
jgi:hypothetical protein